MGTRGKLLEQRGIDYWASSAALAIIRAQSKPQAGYDISGVLNRIEVTPLAAHEIENGPNWSRFPSLLAAASTAIAEP